MNKQLKNYQLALKQIKNVMNAKRQLAAFLVLNSRSSALKKKPKLLYAVGKALNMHKTWTIANLTLWFTPMAAAAITATIEADTS